MGVLKTNAIDVKYHEIFLSWGVIPDPNLPVNVKVVRGDKIDTNYIPYNSFLIKFRLRHQTPLNKELKIDVDINAESGAILL